MLTLLAATASLAAGADLLTLDEAIARARRYHAGAPIAKVQAGIAAALTSQAAAWNQPELRVSGNNLVLDPTALEGRTNIAVRWSPPRPGERRHRIAAAEAGEKAVVASERESLRLLDAETRLAFARASLSAQRTSRAESIVNLHSQALEVVRRQVAEGLKDALAEDAARLSLADAQAGLRRTRAQQQRDLRALAWLVSPDGAVDFQLAPAPDLLATPTPPSQQQSDIANRALLLRSDRTQQELACQQAKEKEALESSRRYPWFNFVQLSRRVADSGSGGAWGLQVGLDIPIFPGSASAPARLAAAESAACRVQSESLDRRIRRESLDAASELAPAAAELQELHALRTGLAADALARTQRALAAGRADRIAVLDAQIRIEQMHDRFLAARIDYAVAEARLEAAAGRP
jgi:outer membrane protein TolC